MTRWARDSYKKTPHDGSKWEEIKEKNVSTSHQRNADRKMSNIDAVKQAALKKNKRSDHRRLKRQRRNEQSKVCFHCRMPGHGMADCPRMLRDNEQGTGICFKCGSTEHTSHTCSAKVVPGKEFVFAKCFVCGQEGHLSKACPDNPRGLYPGGGCCRLCGSVDHYRKDCPERPIKGEVKVYRNANSGSFGLSTHVSVDDEISLYEEQPVSNQIIPAKKPKVVKF